MTSHIDEQYGRFMAGYCSNLPWSFRLVFAVKNAQWRVWQLFSKLQQRRVEKSRGNGKRRGITMRITCHTCHVFWGFGLGKRFRAIATYHQTCHGLGMVERPHDRAKASCNRTTRRGGRDPGPLLQHGGLKPLHEG